MKHIKTFRYRSFVDFVRNAMRTAEPIANPYHAIVKFVFSAMTRPLPAAGFRHLVFGKKPALDGMSAAVFSLIILQVAIAAGLHVMAAAQTAANGVFLAIMTLHDVFPLYALRVFGNNHEVNKRSMCHAL